MAQITDSGLQLDDYSDIVDQIVEDFKDPETGYGKSFPTTPDSGAGILINQLAATIVDLQQLVAAVVQQLNVDTASGVYLDYLARDRGLRRYSEEGSKGKLLFKVRTGATISRNFPSANDNGETVLTDEEYISSSGGSYKAYFTTASNSIVAGDDYSISIQGEGFEYIAGTADTKADVINELYTAIDNTNPTGYSVEVDEDGYLVVTYSSRNNSLTTASGSTMEIYALGVLVDSTSATIGEISFPAGAITNIQGTNTNILSVTNPLDFDLGRLTETDEELRVRIKSQKEGVGKATKPSIETLLSAVNNVTFAYVQENRKITEENGISGKSYRPYVGGGDESQIADVIWDSKPAGIETVGDITQTVIDENGEEQAVNFSRPEDVYAWVKVSYEINSEEEFPSQGSNQIIDAVLQKGSTFYYGDDLDPNKFYGSIYSEVQGIFVRSVEVDITSNPTDTPTYVNTVIPVSNTQEVVFDSSRVSIVLV